MLDQRLIFKREKGFHTTVDIPGHEVGRPQVDLFVSAIAEVVDAAVLEKTADNAGDFDVLADARESRTKTARAAHQ